MKVFISQPMRGKTDEEILKAREDAIVEIHKKYPSEQIEIIDSFFVDEHKKLNAVQCLGQSIELLGEADLVVFLNGWKDARGCVIENIVCNEYNISWMEI